MVHDEVASMLKAGVIAVNTLPFNSPIVFAKKECDTRFCIYFLRHNDLTVIDTACILSTEIMFTKLCYIPRLPDLAPKWVRLAPNGTNPGNFQIRFSTF